MVRLCVAAAAVVGFASSAWAAEGTLVVLNKSDASASLFDAATGRELAYLPTGVGPHEAAVSPDGRTAVVADYGDQTPGNTLTVIDLTAREIVGTIDLGEHVRPHGIEYFDDGQRVAVTSEQRKALVIVNVERGEIVAELEHDQNAGHMVVMSPDESRAFVSNIASGTIVAFDLATGENLGAVFTGAGAEGIDIAPDGSEIWVTNREADTVSVIDSETLEITKTLPCARFPIRAKFTPDGGRVLVSCAMSGEVAVFDAESKREVARVPMTDRAADDQEDRMFTMGGPVPIGILIPPKGDVAFIANTNADTVTVIDLESLTIRTRFDTRKSPDGMAWSALVADGDAG
ncbi:MAG: cytochrome D1 domain-containing protein [Phycisphaerales bacterium]